MVLIRAWMSGLAANCGSASWAQVPWQWCEIVPHSCVEYVLYAYIVAGNDIRDTLRVFVSTLVRFEVNGNVPQMAVDQWTVVRCQRYRSRCRIDVSLNTEDGTNRTDKITKLI